MTIIDDRIRQLVQEMVDTAPVVEPSLSRVGPSAPATRRVAPAVLVAAVVLLGIATAVWFERSDGTSETIASALDDPSRDADGVLVLEADEWLFPEYLPDGLTFGYGLVTGESRSLLFSDPAGPMVLSIGSLPAAFLAPTDPTDASELGGRSWDRLAGLGYALETTDGWVLVGGVAIEDEVIEQIIDSLVIRGSSALPRRPLDTVGGEYSPVAQVGFQGRTVSLEVATDGVVYASRIDGSASCCLSLDADELLRVTASGPGPEAEALAYGLVDEAVALIELYPASGPVVRVEPQDLDGDLAVDFFVAAFPTTSEVLRGPLPAVILYDAAGDEIGRSDLDDVVVRRG